MRIINSFKNFIYGVSGQLINNALSFVVRTIFIQQLGVYYLGVSGLFSNILQVFSLAELGIGTAIFVFLFKPISENDTSQINALINFYAKIFRYIGLTIALFGIISLPFLKYIIKGDANVEHLNIIYILFVANSTISYFFSYYRALVTADQKEYVAFNNSNIFIFIQYLIQIVILYLTKNYIYYLTVTILFTFSSNLSLSIIVKRRYPYLSNRKLFKLSRYQRKQIFRDILAMMSHKIGRVVLIGTDNILISSYIGLYWVGLYSNYLMIINIINAFVQKVFASISASIGNLNQIEGKDKGYEIYNIVNFIGFWLFGFVSICFYILFNPFIILWIGEEYLLDSKIVLVIVSSFFLTGISTINKDYVTLTKLYNITKYKPWFEVSINLSFSILLIKNYGMIGVFFGTIISNLLTSFWFDPYVLFKYRFNRKLSIYFIKYTWRICIVLVSGLITYLLSGFFSNIIMLFILCTIVPNLIFFLVYFESNELNYLKKSLQILINNKKNIF